MQIRCQPAIMKRNFPEIEKCYKQQGKEMGLCMCYSCSLSQCSPCNRETRKENRKGKEAGGHRRGETNETSQFPVEMIRFRKAKIRQGRALLPT